MPTRMLVCVLLSGLLPALSCTAGEAKAPPRVTVRHAEVRQLTDYLEYNGYLESSAVVEVRARVRGHIEKVHFVDGQLVKKGDLLFELDPRPFQANLDEAREQLRIHETEKQAALTEAHGIEAQKHVLQAQKESLEAKKRLADVEVERYSYLVKKEAATKSDLDKMVASAGSLAAEIRANDAQRVPLQAQVEMAQAKVLVAEAKADSARHEVTRRELELEYSRVTAPIAGKISRALLTEGNLVNAGGSDPVLTSIVALAPMYVYFNMDERALQRYIQRQPPNQPGNLRQLNIAISFGLETDEGYPRRAVLDFAENRLERATGTFQVRAEVSDQETRLLPGSRVRLRLAAGEPYQALLVPDSAVLSDQDKRYVLVVKEGNLVQRRNVILGRVTEDGLRVVRAPAGKETALSEVDWIIVQGLQRARLHYPVEPLDGEGKLVASRG